MRLRAGYVFIFSYWFFSIATGVVFFFIQHVVLAIFCVFFFIIAAGATKWSIESNAVLARQEGIENTVHEHRSCVDVFSSEDHNPHCSSSVDVNNTVLVKVKKKTARDRLEAI